MLSDIFLENFYVHTVFPPERQIQSAFPLKEIGFLEAMVHKELIYNNMLEFTLRLSSEEPYAVDILDGVRYETPFPHILIKKPGLSHSYQTESPRKAFFLQYQPEIAVKMEEANFPFTPLIWQFSLTDAIADKIDRLLKLIPLLHLPLMKEKADSLAWSLLLDLLEYRSGVTRNDEVFSRLQRTSFYLLTHYLEAPSVPALARMNGFSERNFLRYWKKYYNETPLQMIRRLKLDHAKNCLLRTGMTIGEIAEMLHFNPIYFERFFRQETGCTPLQYRKIGRSQI